MASGCRDREEMVKGSRCGSKTVRKHFCRRVFGQRTNSGIWEKEDEGQEKVRGRMESTPCLPGDRRGPWTPMGQLRPWDLLPGTVLVHTQPGLHTHVKGPLHSVHVKKSMNAVKASTLIMSSFNAYFCLK